VYLSNPKGLSCTRFLNAYIQLNYFFPFPCNPLGTANETSETLYICGFRGGIPESQPDNLEKDLTGIKVEGIF
jgi:hypothetical protein